MPLELWVAGAILVSLIIYVLGGGADFGGGVWDLFASGPRKAAQRETIAHAIGPIWEANHVWLILVVVLLFIAFPAAFAAITTALHIPLTILLIGIVLRGSAFTFRSYDQATDAVQRRWGRIFAIASLVSPIMLGVCVGAVASGRIHVQDGRVLTNFVSEWLAPFPFAIGFLALALFAFLAAVYLTVEAEAPDLQEDFRRRALLAAVLVGALAWVSLALAGSGAPRIYRGLTGERWSLFFQLVLAVIAIATLHALWRRAYRRARALAVVQVTLVLWGWGLAQFPYVVEPDLTFRDTAAPASVLRVLLVALGAGMVVLLPSMWYLFRVFKLSAPPAGTSRPTGR
jgi:cytochrome d ubiquinol oxidase subunit II